ncbi:hypothetical protein N7447_010656 [Penicillium robsamsonii]|uniref:uncharacterized protein n=1 Tax=Penicillium robsamsonii TaxID=1792511 RepID=UPI0025468AFF|nr:uncharacterized protein N7447_010656 [Penicillium robsamsonii]KAJ5811140.1 hypothetical protein N7447_010656 [Penicillium robsamsonii]
MMETLSKFRLKELEGSRKQRDAYRVILTIMVNVKSTVGAVICHCPAAAAGWALACLVVIPITEHVQEIDANQEGLNYILSMLPWFNKLVDLVNSDTWSNTPSIKETRNLILKDIVNLYSLLIEYPKAFMPKSIG